MPASTDTMSSVISLSPSPPPAESVEGTPEVVSSAGGIFYVVVKGIVPGIYRSK